MKKRYIVCINTSTNNQNVEFVKYLRQKKYSWWHYLNNTWLIVDKKGTSNITELRDNVKVVFDNEFNMLFELKEGEGTWSGFGPRGPGRDMFKWIKENWK